MNISPANNCDDELLRLSTDAYKRGGVEVCNALIDSFRRIAFTSRVETLTFLQIVNVLKGARDGVKNFESKKPESMKRT